MRQRWPDEGTVNAPSYASVRALGDGGAKLRELRRQQVIRAANETLVDHTSLKLGVVSMSIASARDKLGELSAKGSGMTESHHQAASESLIRSSRGRLVLGHTCIFAIIIIFSLEERGLYVTLSFASKGGKAFKIHRM